ncbi:MAG: helix-hairpin-helix domain-containing protein [Pseudomonadota bacterium]
MAFALVCSSGFGAVDINSANRAQLEAVCGVGTEVAERILLARQQGPFKDWADLMARVPGMGAASAARLSANGMTVVGLP